MKHCNFGQQKDPSDVCVVNIDSFGGCSKANSYGYKSNQPCIFLKLNKIFGWEPEVYDEAEKDMPETLKYYMKDKSPEQASHRSSLFSSYFI